MPYIGRILGLTGPSGVGKGFVKDHIKEICPGITELTVATTRGKRPADGIDRDAGIPVGVFLERVNGGTIVFAHQPFGPTNHWYGFYQEQIEKLLDEGKLTMTEIHVDNVEPFKERYGHHVSVIGLVSEINYLRRNIEHRSTEEEEEQRLRLTAALREMELIRRLKEKGLVDSVLEVDERNRDVIADLVTEKLAELGIGELIGFRKSPEK